MEKVLVTGANGFIGSHVFDYFNRIGYTVVGWGNCSIDRNKALIKKVDLSNTDEIEMYLNIDMPNIIIHCAGSANVAESITNPKNDLQGNTIIVHNLLFTLKKLKLSHVKVIILSSAAVYGNPIKLPIKECTPVNPVSPYALHKQMVEDICHYFIRNHRMNIKILRIFSAYGCGLKKQIFWDMYVKYMNTDKLEMFGSGDESRDFINIEDVVQAIYLISTSSSGNQIYNIANGEEIKIKEVVQIFADNIGLPTQNISFIGKRREGDPINWKADIHALKSLGYKKRITIEDGIKKYVEWLQDEKYLFKPSYSKN